MNTKYVMEFFGGPFNRKVIELPSAKQLPHKHTFMSPDDGNKDRRFSYALDKSFRSVDPFGREPDEVRGLFIYEGKTDRPKQNVTERKS